MYLNPCTDPTLTVENIGPIMEAVGNWRKLATDFLHFLVPDAIQERITHLHTTNKERSCAVGEWWVNICPYPSWDRLATVLYSNGEDRALEKMAQYLPRGMCMDR